MDFFSSACKKRQEVTLSVREKEFDLSRARGKKGLDLMYMVSRDRFAIKST